jgi:hypothetical protein
VTVRAGWPPFAVWRERKLHRSARLTTQRHLLASEAFWGKTRPDPWDRTR